MIRPDVDVIIAVHQSERPIERAIDSVLTGASATVRVTVVAHNIGADLIGDRLGLYSDDQRVRLVELKDGIPSPSGPFNHGLDLATAEFTSVLGSDDELQKGAVDSWLGTARRRGAQAVLPRLVSARFGSTRTPPTRPLRSQGLDGARDRLAYRTAPLGLVSRDRFADLRFTAGIHSGEDIEYGLRIWFSGARIAFDRHGPGYLIHDEETEGHTTSVRRNVMETFAFLPSALDPAWMATLDGAARRSIVIKLLRTQVMDAVAAFLSDQPADLRDLAAVIDRIVAFAPEAMRCISARDARILTEVLTGSPDLERIASALARRTEFRRGDNLVSARLAASLRRDAPLRFLAATALTP